MADTSKHYGCPCDLISIVLNVIVANAISCLIDFMINPFLRLGVVHLLRYAKKRNLRPRPLLQIFQENFFSLFDLLQNLRPPSPSKANDPLALLLKLSIFRHFDTLSPTSSEKHLNLIKSISIYHFRVIFKFIIAPDH